MMTTYAEPLTSSSSMKFETPVQIALRVLANIAEDSRLAIDDRIAAAKAILDSTKP
jgi:hypothetical protein